ncbi:hypothetical protein [Calothrix sp. PCC 6303]|nr:hypothetical protein [Calothrix sp. PCC 6303]
MQKNSELNINQGSNLRWKLEDRNNPFSAGQFLSFKTVGKPL